MLFLGHNPDGGMLNPEVRQNRIQTTKISLEACFGKQNISQEVWNFGENESEDNDGEESERKEAPHGDDKDTKWTTE